MHHGKAAYDLKQLKYYPYLYHSIEATAGNESEMYEFPTVACMITHTGLGEITISFSDAVSWPESMKRKDAMQFELNRLII